MTEWIVDLSDGNAKRQVLDALRMARGVYRITLKLYRNRRSNQANRFYHGVVVSTFADFLRGQGMNVTNEYAHEVLKAKHLKESVADPRTGEYITDRVRSTASLDTDEFALYLHNCIEWLRDFFGIEIPELDTQIDHTTPRRVAAAV